MKVDRVAPMSALRQEADPAWARAKMRRRRFTEEVPEAESAEEEPDPGTEDLGGEHEGSLDLTA